MADPATQASAYPLAWPPGWPRTALPQKASFKTTLPAALNQLQTEVRLLGGRNLVLSSNVSLGAERPADRAVFAYFTYDGAQVSIPCDRWNTVQDNVRAIVLTIEAMRGMERWGAKHMIRAMFQGFIALPAPADDWRQLLDDPADLPAAEAAYRVKMQTAHPDRGGDADLAARLNKARAAAREHFQRKGQP